LSESGFLGLEDVQDGFVCEDQDFEDVGLCLIFFCLNQDNQD